MKLNNRGFSLVSVLMAAGMLGGLSVVMMQFSKQSTKSTVKFQFDTEVTQITNEINGILSNPASCLATVQLGANPSNIVHVPPTGSSVNKYTTSGGPYGNAGIKISSYTLNLTGTDEANLQINFENKNILKNSGGTNNTISKTIKLEITPSSATTSATVTSCRSVSSATDTMWSRQSGTPANIYYNGGNVGIGMNDPKAKLDVAGGIKSGSETQATTCNVDTEGTQRYNKSLHQMEYCGYNAGPPVTYSWQALGIKNPAYTCYSGWYMNGFNADGTPRCHPPTGHLCLADGSVGIALGYGSYSCCAIPISTLNGMDNTTYTSYGSNIHYVPIGCVKTFTAYPQ